jgi:hypothetical protein
MKVVMEQARGDLSALREAAEHVSNLVVNCRLCSKCCESGLVYVLPEESGRLEALGVPLVTIDGISYIQRAQGGACPMLDRQGSRCTIYHERPICCRLYPLDLFSRNAKLEWGLYQFCPIDRKKEAVLVLNNTGRMDHGLVLQALRMIENLFGEDRIHYLAKEDLVASKVELLDRHRHDYVILGSVSHSLCPDADFTTQDG